MAVGITYVAALRVPHGSNRGTNGQPPACARPDARSWAASLPSLDDGKIPTLLHRQEFRTKSLLCAAVKRHIASASSQNPVLPSASDGKSTAASLGQEGEYQRYFHGRC